MSERRVIIVGHRGQDGRLLTQLLHARGDAILGIGRTTLDALGNIPQPSTCRLDAPDSIFNTIKLVQPHEIYYLAAHYGSSQTRQPDELHTDYMTGLSVNVAGPLHVLEAIRLHSPQTRLFFASTSLIFGNNPIQTPQDESTPASPEEPYALQKHLAAQACKDYRTRHNVFAAIGILFNHESAFRPPQFLSMKIIRAALAAKAGSHAKLVVGNLDATVDWGYAPDFVDAFTRILALETANDFVIATGTAHTVRDFLTAAFAPLGLDWQNHVVEDATVLARPRTGRVGNPAKLQHLTGWQPDATFSQMVQTLINQVTERNSSA